MRTLVLGLGNELASDDAVGVLVARAVRERIADGTDVVESSASGMALIEILAGSDRAIVVDSILTGRNPPGTITELGLEQIGRVVAPSLHQAGLPEMAAVAERLGLEFPSETRVLAVEVRDPYTLGGPVSTPVAAAVDELARRVCNRVERWASETARAYESSEGSSRQLQDSRSASAGRDSEPPRAGSDLAS